MLIVIWILLFKNCGKNIQDDVTISRFLGYGHKKSIPGY